MTSLVQKHGRQCRPCFVKFSLTLQTEILSTETSHFLKRIIFLKMSYNEMGFPLLKQSPKSRVLEMFYKGNSVVSHPKTYNDDNTVELQRLEHLWNHENMFETGVVRAN